MVILINYRFEKAFVSLFHSLANGANSKLLQTNLGATAGFPSNYNLDESGGYSYNENSSVNGLLSVTT